MALKRPGWLGIVLALSLLGNFVVLGAVGGFFLGGWHQMPVMAQGTEGAGPGSRRDPAPPLLRPILKELAPSQARDFIRSLRDAQRDAGLTRDAQRALRGALADAIAAEPFDAGAVETALAGARLEQDNRLAVTHGVLVQALAELSAQDRAAIAEEFRRTRRGPGRR